ncbi:hypothetical protein CEXT_789821 [Caerostris extrusa]|uniref:Uncharacterized protein n=1 Tax=Caerostris extrusa TaxID=172846 RepID=A0AAV4MH53_CAEEX|nr:hypothetical protein CEXT_789821 [Caerostris extrusa]
MLFTNPQIHRYFYIIIGLETLFTYSVSRMNMYSSRNEISSKIQVQGTDKEFLFCLNNLKAKKSQRRDKIHAESFEHIGPNAKSTLLGDFNHIWKAGIVSDDWMRARIVHI